MLVKFNLEIEPEAFADIQQAVDYYNSREHFLGKRFSKQLISNSIF